MKSMVLRAIGVIATTGLALSACTGSPPDPEALVSPSNDPTSVASASPSPEAPAKPERPEAMKRKDAEGAAAAAEYFIELYPYVMSTGDTEEFEAMSHRACGFCADALEQAAKISTRDETWTGGEIRSTLLETYKRDDVTGIYPLDVEVWQAAAQIKDSGGATVFDGAAEWAIYRVELGRKKGSWIVAEIAPGPVQ